MQKEVCAEKKSSFAFLWLFNFKDNIIEMHIYLFERIVKVKYMGKIYTVVKVLRKALVEIP